MSRPPEPQFLIDYREWLQAGPPKCCHTCEHYGVDGLCAKHEMAAPPAEFAATEDECPDWIMECPF
jgi:hypothetical protein